MSYARQNSDIRTSYMTSPPPSSASTPKFQTNKTLISSAGVENKFDADDKKMPNFLRIRKTLHGQSLLVTGSTGFLGKVLIEKILRSIPSVKRIYLLIRPSRGKTSEERLENEIIKSECFNRLRKTFHQQHRNFNQFMREKLVAVSGELTRRNAGISQPEFELLCKQIDVVVHCAASVDFNERIDRALELNVFGTKRIFEMSKSFRRLRAFVHISTCYVNAHMEGLLHEELYPLNYRIDQVIDKVSKMNVNEMNTLPFLTDLLGDYPNTYTFTKSISEHLLEENRGKIPLAIIRPSVIGSAQREPVPGWVDVATAAGAPILAAGLGVLRIFPGKLDNVLDVIPVDYCVANILASIPDIIDKDQMKIYASSSSTINPTTLADIEFACVDFFRNHPSSHAFSRFSYRTVGSPQLYEIAFFLLYSVPAALMNTVALFGTDTQKRLALSYERLVIRARSIAHNFRHFTEHDQQFDCSNTSRLQTLLDDEEKKIFHLDLKSLDQIHYHKEFAYGLLRYVLKENIVEVPFDRSDTYISLKCSYVENVNSLKIVNYLFPNFDQSYQTCLKRQSSPVSYMEFANKASISEMQRRILSSDEIRYEIDHLINNEAGDTDKRKDDNNSIDKSYARRQLEQKSRQIVERMVGDLNSKALIGFGWLLKRIFSHIFESIYVNRKGLEMIRQVAGKSPLILLPTHRSYIDFLVCSFICYAFQLPIPYIAAGEDFLGIFGLRTLFRKSGAFFIRRSFSGDKLYQTIFDKYISLLLSDNQCLEFFIEGTRSRSGKMLHPKLGMLTSVTSNQFKNEKIKDINFVPITINYEKTLEGNLYGSELMGDSKIKESLRSLISSAAVLTSNYGRIAVKICRPISLQNFVKRISPSFDRSSSSLIDTAVINQRLAYEVVWQLSMNTECMPTHLVSTFLLMYRQGITRNQLIEKVDQLRRQLYARAAPVSFMETYRRDKIVDSAITFLRNVIVERRKNLFEPAISSKSDYQNLLVLGHYRNKIVPQFFLEGILACSLYSFGDKLESGIAIGDLMKEVRFLHALLDHEFIYRRPVNICGDEGSEKEGEDQDLTQTLQKMIDLGILNKHSNSSSNKPKEEQSIIELLPTGEVHFSFLCAMFWPFIDSYFVTTLTLFVIQPSHRVNESDLIRRAQQLGTTLYAEGRLSFYEACSMDTLRNALYVLSKWKVVRRTHAKLQQANQGVGSGKYGRVRSPSSSESSGSVSSKTEDYYVELLSPYEDETKLQELVSHIGRFRKPAPVSPTFSRRNLIADIPILAKL